MKGSGRLELAQLADRPANPLSARVMVNRIWQYHFGQGIVATPNDFGKQGQPPTHPELLDYLASRSSTSGWSIKAMHRLIMLSRTYQLAEPRRRGEPRRSIPDNDFCGASRAAGSTPRRSATRCWPSAAIWTALRGGAASVPGAQQVELHAAQAVQGRL